MDHGTRVAPLRVSLGAVRFGYSRRTPPAIEDLSLELSGPGRVGLLGPNGSGKTTLIKIIATALTPQRGRLDVAGFSLTDARARRKARPSIGYLPQRFGYFKGFTAAEFVTYCLWVRGARYDGHLVTEALAGVGMADLHRARLGSLSGGQVQRVGIAQAIAGRPPLVILDEPSAGLDPAQRVRMRAALLALDSSLVVMSTHLIEDVVLVAESAVVVDRGRIIHQGPTESLIPEVDGHSARRSSAPAGVSAAEAGYLDLLGPAGDRR